MASNTTYGDYIGRIPVGFMGIGWTLTWTGLGVVLVGFVCLMLNPFLGLGVLLAGVGAIAFLARRDAQHRNVADRMAERMAARRRVREGRGLYRSGMLGLFEAGRCPLPGVAGDTVLLEAVDGGGEPFALVRHRYSGEYTLMFACRPQGAALVDDDVEDAYVAGWAAFLESMARTQGVTQVMAVVDTSPDSGARVHRALKRRVVEDAPELAARAMGQVMLMMSRGGARNDVTVSVNFRYEDVKGRPLDEETAARQIGNLIPQMRRMLADSGGGAARCLTMDDAAYIALTCYDPASQERYERFDERPHVEWEDAGPTMADPDPVHDLFAHDSGLSRTWEMVDPPNSNVTADTLGSLLEPLDECDRKRVAVVYRLMTPAASRFVTEQNRRKSSAAQSQQKQVTISAMDTTAKADSQAADVNQGAVLCWFGLLVTATVLRGDDEEARLDAASRAVEAAAGASVLTLRSCRAAQDTGFAASLPFGLNVGEYQPPSLLGRIG